MRALSLNRKTDVSHIIDSNQQNKEEEQKNNQNDEDFILLGLRAPLMDSN